MISAKLQCGENRFLQAEIHRAVSIPSKSVLFNIDQKADVISKDDVDALLSVFVKVFNEMQGYFGKQGHIAQFERELDNRDLYDPFREAYEQIAGIPWQTGREQSILEGANIAQAYEAVTGNPASEAEGILDKYRDSYRVSIEDFADMVRDYVEREGPKFRLNFFVDEAGQYIAENVKLMTNLQTIAESLATRCRGRAWLIVTAQEDMDTVVGEMGKQQSNDFSKIQDRFYTRMKLTSQDVAEVTQKRLLAKNDVGEAALTDVYQQQVNNFKTLFEFADGGQTYRNYRDQDHFINSYPFIPYQIVLFQSAIQSLSQHNAFEGQHSSVGERSMLGVFQQVAMQIGDHELGQLATFDLMFEGIRNSLKANIQRSILVAEDNLEHPFAIRLLKALFLVKYVKEFKATERNLAVLMIERFGQDITRLQKQIEEALNILEQQTYIQRNGAEYEYLTDEEKDVEQDIKNTEVENTSVVDELATIVFDRVIRETKIRAETGQHDYPFTRMVDGRHFKGNPYELAIHLVTPFNEHTANLPVLLSQSMGRDELFVILPADDRLMRDLRLYKQTIKYYQQNINTAQNDSIKMILANKQFQNNERHREIVALTEKLLSGATFIVNGSELDLNGSDAQTRIIRGFHQLIRMTYTNLKMLGNIVYKEADLPRYLRPDNDMFGSDVIELTEPEREILNYITLQKSIGIRVTAKSLVDKFERKPYGWYLAAILCVLAKLYARGRVEVRHDSNVLEVAALEQALTNTRLHPNLILAPEEEFSPAQIRTLKNFYNEFFDKPAPSEEAKDLARQTKEALQGQVEKLSDLAHETHRYPFLRALGPVIDRLRTVTGKSYDWYLTDFGEDANELLDMKDDVISPILSFMNGGQRDIFDQASDFLIREKANFQYLGQDDAFQIHQILGDESCYRGDAMRQVKHLMDGLQDALANGLIQTKEAAVASVDSLQAKLEATDEFGRLSQDQQQDILTAFEERVAVINNQELYAMVNEAERSFREQTYSDILSKMERWLQPVDGGDTEPQYIARNTIQVAFDKPWLADEDDLQAYLEALRAAYWQQIRDGKRIQL